MSSALLFGVVLVYLGLLFFVAYHAEKKRGQFWLNNPYVYALSLGIYCTAWTYYGSIGVAANQGLEYMAIYIGPAIVIPAWIYINTKIIRIARVNKIASIADFIGLRYGNGRSLGALVTLVCIAAILPYIGLQIKAVSESFHELTQTLPAQNIFLDTTTYIVIIIALFSSYYGTRYVDASEKRLGIISAVAVESFLKIIFFIVLGLFVVYGIFSGFGDIYAKASRLPDFKAKNTINGLEGAFNWFLVSLLSMTVIFVLPRQFHAAIVENRQEKHVRTAIWLVPLYLLVFNFFVFPIAWGGKIIFADEIVNPEFFSLLIPQKFGYDFIALMVFLGGLSASISMIIISSISLSVMLSNNIIIPYGWLETFKIKNVADNTKSIVNIRKISIFALIVLSFGFYKYLLQSATLFSVGLISFILVAQLAPSFFGAIWWRRGTYKGALAGILAGVTVCYIQLILPEYFPFFKNTFAGAAGFLQSQYLTPISNTFFWSILINTCLFMVVSLFSAGSYRERNYAEIYVDINDYIKDHENAYIWRGTAYRSDITKILERFLGEKKTYQALRIFDNKYNISDDSDTADSRFIKFSENLLSGRIGTASAKILIEGVAKEEKISLTEVLSILEESKETITTNRKLTEQSQQLKRLSDRLKEANSSLIEKDLQKDEFLDSVAHELRTPITAIRATGEVLLDDKEMPHEIRKQFLENIVSESDRLAEIINDLLFLDKLDAGKESLNLTENSISSAYLKAFRPLETLMNQKHIQHVFKNNSETDNLPFDEMKMIQVFQNILGNAIKFTPENGLITTEIHDVEKSVIIEIHNNGKPIPEEDLEFIFDKFYQSKTQNLRKQSGSGLGLAICRKILEAHGGKINAENTETGVKMNVILPQNSNDL